MERIILEMSIFHLLLSGGGSRCRLDTQKKHPDADKNSTQRLHIPLVGQVGNSDLLWHLDGYLMSSSRCLLVVE